MQRLKNTLKVCSISAISETGFYSTTEQVEIGQIIIGQIETDQSANQSKGIFRVFDIKNHVAYLLPLSNDYASIDLITKYSEQVNENVSSLNSIPNSSILVSDQTFSGGGN